jgi:hypothetical protein
VVIVKKRWSVLAAVSAAVVLSLGVVLDLLGVLRPAPSADRLIQEVSERWSRMPDYHAEVSVGRRAGPTHSRQWFTTDGALTLAVRDPFGFTHAERWTGAEWQYYQGGPDLLVNVGIEDGDRVPFARWMVTGYPTLEDLVSVLRSSRDVQLAGSTGTADGPVWVLRFRPDPMPGEGAPASFCRRTFDAPWTVWISSKTYLPIHVQINDAEDDPLRIGIENLRLGVVKPPEEWRSVVGEYQKVRKRLTLTCSATVEPEVEEVKQRIRQEVDSWRKTLFQSNSAGTEQSLP